MPCRACSRDGCQLWLPICCHCSDKRPQRASYDAYVDGRGWVSGAPRNAGYCQVCRSTHAPGSAQAPSQSAREDPSAPSTAPRGRAESTDPVVSARLGESDEAFARRLAGYGPPPPPSRPRQHEPPPPPPSEARQHRPPPPPPAGRLPPPGGHLPPLDGPLAGPPAVAVGCWPPGRGGGGIPVRPVSLPRPSVDADPLREALTCPLCLGLLNTPVTTHCGHTFCRACLVAMVDAKPGSRTLPCPLDRGTLQCQDLRTLPPSVTLNSVLALLTRMAPPSEAAAGGGGRVGRS